MTTRNPKTPNEARRDAIAALKTWRCVDRAHCEDKGNDSLSRAEYLRRQQLRTAADNLTEARNA